MRIRDAVVDCSLSVFSASVKTLAFLLLLLLALSRCSKMRWLIEMHLEGGSQSNDVSTQFERGQQNCG